ncbi:hypothetical protein [Flaviflexus huanghaiensis]|uniref:hypothetical protein n=1 Tax=Flaviflexus huanghaiensis TaxID=1111473 RepID=UPI0015FD0960|nr:hypothetical protein [Flaviflexus huanghaiensis]
MIDKMMKADPLTDAATTAGITLAYYAMPDFVRSRLLRYFGKMALLGLSTGQVIVTANATLPNDLDSLRQFVDDSDGETLKKTAGILAGAGLASTIAVLAGEKYIFNRGERKRAAGVSFPHTKQGLVLAVLAGGLIYVLEKSEQNRD